MNTASHIRAPALALGLSMLLLGLAGCASHKVNWSARVGSYTFDQAVLDMGPPSKQAALQDGTVVAEWMTQRGYTETYYTPYYGPYWGYGYRHRYYYGPMFAMPIETSTPDVFIRLTFGPDGKLTAWKKVAL